MKTVKYMLAVSTIVSASIYSCTGTQFEGSGASSKKAPAVKTPVSGDDPATGQQPQNPSTDDQTSSLDNSDGGLSFVDFKSCSDLASHGLQNGGVCAEGKVIVVINDGSAAGQTCCPIGEGVLSSVAAEKNVLRAGQCGVDEVATGMQSMSPSKVYCTKVNTAAYKVESTGIATHVNENSVVIDTLKTLVSSYHRKDCCVCPEGSVMAGGHSGSDNSCSDQCVKINKLELP